MLCHVISKWLQKSQKRAVWNCVHVVTARIRHPSRKGSTEIAMRTTATATMAETILNAAENEEETVKLDDNKNGNHKKYLLPVPLFFCLQGKPPNEDWE